jgi:hypothetical protein
MIGTLVAFGNDDVGADPEKFLDRVGELVHPGRGLVEPGLEGGRRGRVRQNGVS